MADKLDFKKRFKELYNPHKAGFHIVEVPKLKYLSVDGEGDPTKTPEYQEAVEALYTISYGIKFAYKAQGLDHVVPPLEGLWWMEDMSEFSVANKYRWKWRMMIAQPEWVTVEATEEARSKAQKKKGIPSLALATLDLYNEGRAVQILYIGAYVDEGPTIGEMHKFILANGYQSHGKHHEIYLGDPRKTAPEKLQTILRQPIRELKPD